MPAKPPSFSFCSDPEPCRALWELALQNPLASSPFGAESSGAIGLVLGPQWDGASQPAGRAFACSLLAVLCPALFTRWPRGTAAPAPEIIQTLCGAIERAAAWPEAEPLFKRLINKTTPQARDLAGPYAPGAGSPEGARAVLLALARHGSPPQRAALAAKLLPPWARKVDPKEFRDLGLFTSVYLACFEAGSSVNDVFNLSPKPGLSVADQIKGKLSEMPQGELRSLFLSAFERESLQSPPPGSLGPAALEAKGLPPETLAALLGAIGALEEALPGDGARAALAWLHQHPALAKAPSAAAPDPASGPPPATSHRPPRL